MNSQLRHIGAAAAGILAQLVIVVKTINKGELKHLNSAAPPLHL